MPAPTPAPPPYASATLPGILSTGAQTLGGLKRLVDGFIIGSAGSPDRIGWINSPNFNDGFKVTVPAGTTSNAQYVMSAGTEPANGEGAVLQLNSALNTVDANALILANRCNGPTAFWSNDLERARFLANGKLLINRTTDDGSSAQVQVSGTIHASGGITGSGLSGSNTGDLTLGATTSGLSLSSQVLSLALATVSTPGAMSAADKTNLDALVSSGGGTILLAAVGSSPSANGATASGMTLTLQPADGTHPGLLTSGSQVIGGAKTFSGAISASNLSGTNSGDITLGTASGLSLSSQALSLALATTSTPGAMSAADKTNLDGLVAGGGTILLAAVGSSPNAYGASASGMTLTLQPSDATHPGVLTAADWTTFNGKQASGNYLTDLTGDVTASGPGSAAAAVAFVGGSTAAAVHTSQLATAAATALNTASTLVLRDGSGNFAAGTITAALTGNVTGNVTGNASGSAGSFTGSLLGDVTGTQGATVVALVNGSSAANVHAAELLANAATDANTASAIVKRDGSGNFSAGALTLGTALTIGNGGTGQTTAANALTALLPAQGSANGKVLGSNGTSASWVTAATGGISALTGDVTASGSGSVAATVALVGGSAATDVHAAELAANAAVATATASTILKRDGSANARLNNLIEGYTTTATAAGTTTLTVASTFSQFFTGSTTQIVQLPDATTLVLGHSFQITNRSTGVVTVKNAGSTTVLAVPAGATIVFTCTSIGSTNGTWDAGGLQAPTTSSLGGVNSHAQGTNQFLTAIGTDGTVSGAQPAFTDLSGSLAASQLPSGVTLSSAQWTFTGNSSSASKTGSYAMTVLGGANDGIKVMAPAGSANSAQFVLSAGSEPAGNQGAMLQLNSSSNTSDANALFLYNRTNGALIIATNSSEKMRFLAAGNILMNTSTDIASTPFQVCGTPATQATNGKAIFSIIDNNTAFGSTPKAGMSFWGRKDSTPNYDVMGSCHVAKANTTSSDAGGDWIFYTRPTGASSGTSLTEAMRLTSGQAMSVAQNLTLTNGELVISNAGNGIKDSNGLRVIAAGSGGLVFQGTSTDALLALNVKIGSGITLTKGGASLLSFYNGTTAALPVAYVGFNGALSTALPSSLIRKLGTYQTLSTADTAFTALNLPAPTIVGTPAADATSATSMMSVKYTSGAVSGNVAGITGPYTTTRFAYQPRHIFVFRTDSSISNTRIFVGLADADISGIATLAGLNTNRVACLRYDTGLSDTTWKFVTSDGTTASTVDTGHTVAASKTYAVQIEATNTSGFVATIFDLTTPANNMVNPASKTTNLPSGATEVGVQASITTLTTSAANLWLARMQLDQN